MVSKGLDPFQRQPKGIDPIENLVFDIFVQKNDPEYTAVQLTTLLHSTHSLDYRLKIVWFDHAKMFFVQEAHYSETQVSVWFYPISNIEYLSECLWLVNKLYKHYRKEVQL